MAVYLCRWFHSGNIRISDIGAEKQLDNAKKTSLGIQSLTPVTICDAQINTFFEPRIVNPTGPAVTLRKKTLHSPLPHWSYVGRSTIRQVTNSVAQSRLVLISPALHFVVRIRKWSRYPAHLHWRFHQSDDYQRGGLEKERTETSTSLEIPKISPKSHYDLKRWYARNVNLNMLLMRRMLSSWTLNWVRKQTTTVPVVVENHYYCGNAVYIKSMYEVSVPHLGLSVCVWVNVKIFWTPFYMKDKVNEPFFFSN